MLWGLVSLKSAGQRADWRPREELTLQLKSEGQWRQNSLFLRGPTSFLLRPSPDWARPTRSGEGSLLYLASTEGNVNLIWKVPHSTM